VKICIAVIWVMTLCGLVGCVTIVSKELTTSTFRVKMETNFSRTVVTI
jgi:hypothetical protein